ncbi:hypothetical protein JA1_002892 [Spathaspora sp. JA1]|nr:hypothetical protein JA1_002892 [Spathaspora sp. JA1]
MSIFALFNSWLLYYLSISIAIATPFDQAEFNLIQEKKPLTFKVYTHNIRFDASNLVPYELPWNQRKEGVVSSMISAVTVNLSTIFTLQEVMHNQLIDIKHGLNTISESWAHVGEGRDGGISGEHNPILYNTNEWDVLTNYTRWLSETPDRPSSFLNKCYNRIVTMGTFYHKGTGSVVNVLNTHFCHKYEDSKQFQANEILKHVDTLTDVAPIIVTGDFNSERSSVAYQILIRALKDQGNLQELPTVSGFCPGEQQTTIDYIFSKGPVISAQHTVLDNILYEGYHFSDHRPVVGVFKVI